MTNSIPTKSEPQAPLRRLTGWQIVRRYRRAGYTQWDIAKEANVSQGTVAKAIHRRGGGGPAVARAWAVLERILTGTLFVALSLAGCVKEHHDLTQADCDRSRYFATQYPDSSAAYLKEADQCDREVAGD